MLVGAGNIRGQHADVDVVAGDEADLAILAGQTRTLDVDVAVRSSRASGANSYIAASLDTAAGQRLFAARDTAVVLAADCLDVARLRIFYGSDAYAASLDIDRLAGIERSTFEDQLLLGLQVHVLAGADVGDGVLAAAVGNVGAAALHAAGLRIAGRNPVAALDGGDLEIAPGAGQQIRLCPDMAAFDAEIAAGLQQHRTRLHRRDAADAAAGAAAVGIAGRRRHGLQQQVAPGHEGDHAVVAGAPDGTAHVVQILLGAQQDVLAMDAPADVLQVLPRQQRHLSTREDAAAVDDVFVALDEDLAAGDQGAVLLQVFALRTPQIHLRHQHFLGLAIGQRHALAAEPDDVGAQQRHLLGRQGNPGTDLESAGIGHAGVHQVLEFGFGTAVAGEEATAGQREDLVVDLLLFVEAVGIALHLALRVHLQLLQEVVAAEEGPLLREARIGLDQDARFRRAVDLEHAGCGNRQAGHGGNDGIALLGRDIPDFKRQAAGGRARDAAAGLTRLAKLGARRVQERHSGARREPGDGRARRTAGVGGVGRIGQPDGVQLQRPAAGDGDRRERRAYHRIIGRAHAADPDRRRLADRAIGQRRLIGAAIVTGNDAHFQQVEIWTDYGRRIVGHGGVGAAAVPTAEAAARLHEGELRRAAIVGAHRALRGHVLHRWAGNDVDPAAGDDLAVAIDRRALQ